MCNIHAKITYGHHEFQSARIWAYDGKKGEEFSVKCFEPLEIEKILKIRPLHTLDPSQFETLLEAKCEHPLSFLKTFCF